MTGTKSHLNAVMPSRHGIVLLLLLAVAGCVWCGCSPVGSDRRAQQVFVSAFEEAHQRGDPSAMLELYALDGVDDETRSVLGFSVATEIDWPLLRVRFVELDPQEVFAYERDGVRYEPSLAPVARVHVEYDLPQRVNRLLPVGRDEQGRYRLVVPRRVTGSAQADAGK